MNTNTDIKTKSKRILSVFSLVMINVIAIDSLRNLPTNAEYGLSVAFFYLLGIIFFLIPQALVTAEMATHRPEAGGSYIWIREAFGPRWGFVSIWLEWIYNVIWFPTILAFVGSSVAYLFNPALASNKAFMFSLIIGMFSIATLVNWFGMKLSVKISTIGTIFGTLIPMLIIIGLGIFWWTSGKTVQIDTSWQSLLPTKNNWSNIGFMVTVLFSLMGLEMSAVHAKEVKNPKKDYPRALLISSVIIVVSSILSSLAVALVVPKADLNIVSGLNQFLVAFHLNFLTPIAIILIILGAFAGMAAWVIGPTKGLVVAAEDGSAPRFFANRNRYQAPGKILIAQGIVVILLSILMFAMPTIKEYYWVLSALTGQLALIYYIFVFSAAIKLRKITPKQEGCYRIPGGKAGIWIVGGMGIFACVTVILAGFKPPADIQMGSVTLYEAILIGGILLVSVIPLIMTRKRK